MVSNADPEPRIAIVIVNWRTAELVVDCLASLAATVPDHGHVQVMVVDNDSPDDSVRKIGQAIEANHWQSWMHVLPQSRNGGFAFGNNQAIRMIMQDQTPPDFIWLLNPDTVVRPGALTELVDFMREHPEVGIAGSRLEEVDGTPQCSAFRFHGILSEFEEGIRIGVISRLLTSYRVAPAIRDQAHRTDWLSGASFMIRRNVIEAIGLLDEAYFMYFEEVDYCLRAHRAGFQCWYVPASRVVHLVGQASGIRPSDVQVKPTPAYWFDSRKRFYIKHYGRARTMLADAAWIIGHMLWRLGLRLRGRTHPFPPGFLKDFIRHSSFRSGAAL